MTKWGRGSGFWGAHPIGIMTRYGVFMFQRRKKRVCVISLDGVPGALLQEAFREERLAPLRSLWQAGGAVELTSTLPPISSVAWATYSTGVGPGGHGVFGFVERNPQEMSQHILTSRDVAAPKLWEHAAQQGKRAAVVNIPLTYPADPLSGWLVAGFPAPELSRAAYPPDLASRLAQEGYLVDPDPGTAGEPPEFFSQIERALATRRRVALELLRKPWDLFHLHIMVTDRLNHFFLSDGLTDGRWREEFWAAYEAVAELVAEVVAALPPGTELVLMSDHGFAPLRWELDLNAFLRELGWLELSGEGEGPARVAPGSTAYSLTPGRIYLLMQGRERDGWIEPGRARDYLERLSEALLSLSTPEGEPAIQRVFLGRDIYHGPKAELGPDLLALPASGVELRGGWSGEGPFRPARRQGGHTLTGAFLWIRGERPRAGEVLDVPATVWALLGLPRPPEFEGKVLI